MPDVSNYPSTSPGELRTLLNGFVPDSTRSAILQALRASGVITSPESRVGLEVFQASHPTRFVDSTVDQVAVLGADSDTEVRSNGAIIVATTEGDNRVDIANANPRRDQADTVFGGTGSDFIQGNTAASQLIGGSGRETLQSGGGTDTIIGGSGLNTLIGGGRSAIFGGTGSAVVRAGLDGGKDTVHAGTGNDTITLRAGDNTVYGPPRAGMATIRAGSGNDTIYGGGGDSTIVGGSSTAIHLGRGDTTLNLGRGAHDTVFGGSNSGPLQLNRSSADVTRTKTGPDGSTTYVFKGGSTLTTNGDITVAFTDHTKH